MRPPWPTANTVPRSITGRAASLRAPIAVLPLARVSDSLQTVSPVPSAAPRTSPDGNGATTTSPSTAGLGLAIRLACSGRPRVSTTRCRRCRRDAKTRPSVVTTNTRSAAAVGDGADRVPRGTCPTAPCRSWDRARPACRSRSRRRAGRCRQRGRRRSRRRCCWSQREEAAGLALLIRHQRDAPDGGAASDGEGADAGGGIERVDAAVIDDRAGGELGRACSSRCRRRRSRTASGWRRARRARVHCRARRRAAPSVVGLRRGQHDRPVGRRQIAGDAAGRLHDRHALAGQRRLLLQRTD